MTIPFSTQKPSLAEEERLRLLLSTFCDGSGMLKTKNGTVIPGWRDAERTVEEAFGGFAPEDKGVFDVYVQSKTKDEFIGYSVKCKNESSALQPTGHVYMELSNSPAKFWDALLPNYTEDDFRRGDCPQEIGQIVLDTVQSWHKACLKEFPRLHPGKSLNLEGSVYLTLSYGAKKGTKSPLIWQWHSFPMIFPRQKDIVFKYNSESCLRGCYKESPSQPLFDWYALSGGQLKYYPQVSDSLFSSSQFELEIPKKITVSDKAMNYWPEKWSKVRL